MNNVPRPIIKSFAGTLRQDGTGRVLRRECWEATTTDGLWAFERIEEPGTPWIIVHFPRTEDAETAYCTFGTLKAARQAVERGIDNWLPSVQLAAHARGEHDQVDSPYGCGACGDRRWGAWQAEPHKYENEHQVDEAYEAMRADLISDAI